MQGHVTSREPIKLGCHPVEFSGHKHSDCRDIMVLVFHSIYKDPVIQGPCDFMSGSLSW